MIEEIKILLGDAAANYTDAKISLAVRLLHPLQKCYRITNKRLTSKS